jgi:hypothetical protein
MTTSLEPWSTGTLKYEVTAETLKELRRALKLDEPAPPAPRYVAMPHGRSLVAPLVTEDGFGKIEYHSEKMHFHYHIPLSLMWRSSALKAPTKAKDACEQLLSNAWAKGSRLSEKLHNIANVMRCIEDGMVQEEPE